MNNLTIDLSNIDIAELSARFPGCDFSDAARRQFLECPSSCDLQAAPGSGKTTLLVARLDILIRRWVTTKADNSGTITNISQPSLLGIEVPVPPLSLQKEFAVRAGEIRTLQIAQDTIRSGRCRIGVFGAAVHAS